MKCTGRSESEYCQTGWNGLALAGGKIDIGKGVEFRHYYVDVVASYAGRYHGKTLPLVCAGYGVEFAALTFRLATVEVTRNECHASRVTDKYDRVGEFFGFQVKVENGAVAVDYELRRWYGPHVSKFFN